MKIDPSKSAYQEDRGARTEFDRQELRRLRFLLRRLRFLEAQVRETPDSTASTFADWEVEALEWVLTEIGFLAVPSVPTGTASRT